MSEATDVLDAPLAGGATATPPGPTRPLYWSLRRELWENRSLYLAPLGVAAIFLFGFLLSVFSLPHRMRGAALDPAKQRHMIELPFDMAAGLLTVTAMLVGALFCLDALHGERRDRSILFWKSLPVSDRTAVLAKAAVPLLVLPAIVLALVLPLQALMLVISMVALAPTPSSVELFWTRLPFVQLWLSLVYGEVVIALWLAPVYAWLLLVSAWARRTPLLWAVIPPLGVCVVEKVAFHTDACARFLGYVAGGWYDLAFVATPAMAGRGPLAHLTPGNLLATPWLWLGVVLATLFLAGAVRLRRRREPI